jgi:hypothetical protein
METFRVIGLSLLLTALPRPAFVQDAAASRIGDRTCADWSAVTATDSAEAKDFRAWMFGYYHGAVKARSGGQFLVRPMGIVSEPSYFGTMGRPNIIASTREWNEEGLADLMTRHCASATTDSLKDAAAAVTKGLIVPIPDYGGPNHHGP